MTIKAKEEFTITFSGEELKQLKTWLGSGMSYHAKIAFECEKEPDDVPYHLDLAKQHRGYCAEIQSFLQKLPTPFGA